MCIYLGQCRGEVRAGLKEHSSNPAGCLKEIGWLIGDRRAQERGTRQQLLDSRSHPCLRHGDGFRGHGGFRDPWDAAATPRQPAATSRQCPVNYHGTFCQRLCRALFMYRISRDFLSKVTGLYVKGCAMLFSCIGQV